MPLRTTRGLVPARVRSAVFSYDSPPAPVESWIANYDDFVAHQPQEGYLILSENIVAAMMART